MPNRVLLAEGREAEVFLQPDGTVLKLMRDPTQQWKVDREAAALRALSVGQAVAPELVEAVIIDGRPGIVMRRIQGEDLLARLGRWPLAVLRAGRALAEAHAPIHEVMAPTSLPDLHGDLRVRIETAEPLPAPFRARALELLEALPQGDRLCHGDLHLGNLIGSWDKPAIIDWGDACRGDPIADVARTELLQRLGSPPPGAALAIRVCAPVGRTALAAQYLATYQKLRPISATELNKWRIVRAAARLREPIPSEHPRLLRYLRRHLVQ
ncbi:MAG TPA: aminoglycoside phosphotransferase family protein [Acidimicrobiales bacterium]|nr:aminoglycoside phosphotransferase family protein [Acidimicrobiales bacterium]